MGQIPFTIQHLLPGTALLTVKIKALSLDIFKLVVLCAEHIDISYDSRVSKMVKGIVDDKAGSAARVKDGVVGVFGTWMMEVRGGVRACMKGGAIDGLVFAFCSLVDNAIVDQEVVDIFGRTRPSISTNEDKRVVTSVARVETHPLAPWVVSVLLHIFCLSGGMSYFCWGGNTVEKGRWGCVN